MQIHCILHEPFEGLAHIEKWISCQNHNLNFTLIYQGQEFPVDFDFELLIIMGGAASVYETDKNPWLLKEKRFIGEAIRLGKKVLGICFGAQILADILGGKVYHALHPEIGWFPVYFTPEAREKFEFLPDEMTAFHWHSDTFDLPPGAIPLASSKFTVNQGFIYGDQVIALQFHLEMTGKAINELLIAMRHNLAATEFMQSETEIRNRVDLLRENNQLMDSFLNQLN